MIFYKKIWRKFYWCISLNVEDIYNKKFPLFPIAFIWKTYDGEMGIK